MRAACPSVPQAASQACSLARRLLAARDRPAATAATIAHSHGIGTRRCTMASMAAAPHCHTADIFVGRPYARPRVLPPASVPDWAMRLCWHARQRQRMRAASNSAMLPLAMLRQAEPLRAACHLRRSLQHHVDPSACAIGVSRPSHALSCAGSVCCLQGLCVQASETSRGLRAFFCAFSASKLLTA